MVSRAEGLAAPVVAGVSARFDNVDVYRIAYLTLFGRPLADPTGSVAPTRHDGTGAPGTTPGQPKPDRVADTVASAPLT